MVYRLTFLAAVNEKYLYLVFCLCRLCCLALNRLMEYIHRIIHKAAIKQLRQTEKTQRKSSNNWKINEAVGVIYHIRLPLPLRAKVWKTFDDFFPTEMWKNRNICPVLVSQHWDWLKHTNSGKARACFSCFHSKCAMWHLQGRDEARVCFTM